MSLIIPSNYKAKMDIRQTEIAIKEIKDFFEKNLATELNLTRVSAPLFVLTETGLNDNLNGVERPVAFGVKDISDKEAEIVHSLAKWKRTALKRYGFGEGEGLYTDMNAIRRDEELDNIHSIYVDQWDWEKTISEGDRTLETLHRVVKKIFTVFKNLESHIKTLYPSLDEYLPKDIYFITSQELENLYPNISPKERENAICKEHRAVFITQIGGVLASGQSHDGRAPDYDDWALNGDLLFWYPPLSMALELSSMGIRVDEVSLVSQIKAADCPERMAYPFHQDILNKRLPLTIGGGLGQSRICMFFLGCAHIGEVQSSIWPSDMIDLCEKSGIELL